MPSAKDFPLRILLFWFNDDWGAYGRAYERVAAHLSHLSEVGQVVCIFPPVSAARIGAHGPLRVRPISEKLSLLSEAEIGESRLRGPLRPAGVWLNKMQRTRALKGYLRQLGFRKDNTILWLFPPHPYLERLLDVVPRRMVVCHVIDDFTKFDPQHVLYGAAHEQYPKLGQFADAIITTSEANWERFSLSGKPCYMFWPAVDESFVGTPEDPPHRASGQPPRLGYVGWIMDRTDLGLVAHVARERPDWRVLLVGPQYPRGLLERSGVLSLPNVEYLGPMAQAEVPAFLQSLDVCLMPHRDDEYSRSMGPLKLYQYLASGRPIVSTKVAGLERVREHVRVAADYREFVQQIDSALRSDTRADSQVRISASLNERWSVRVREMLDVVISHLP